ncbi:DUF6531 domain-containing protein [Streptococcus acidominimus]|uniref:DUF6531 domain-containing protein n=1 Tax=Streptococcus acidominimus TaxID=1326 RepID=UPI001F56F8FD|nr:DUF6531 domain-containing protein [Streptococcus acidominimus]
MKRLHKLMNALVLLVLLVSNSPIMYAEEIGQAIAQSQAEQAHQEAVEEAKSQTVGSENVNKETADASSATPESSKDEGDAIQQPKVVTEESDAEVELKQKYGEPVAVSGQEQLYRVDETHFVTHIGSSVKTYVDQDGVEVPVDLSLYSYHANGNHYYLPKESPVGVVLPSEVKEETPIDVIHQDEKISLYPLETTYDKATVEQNAILYNNVDGKTDVQYTVQSNGVKEEIVLAEWGGKNRFTYGLDAGSYDVRLENNQVLVREKGKSKILFVLTAPIMVDAAGETSQDVTLELSEKSGKYQVTVVAGKDWLSSKERKYPVRIDPTVTVPRENILDVVTSSIRGTYQGLAYGYVGYIESANMGMEGIQDIGKTRMYVKVNYDFSSIPKEARIDSASLNLYQYSDGKGTAAATFGAYYLKQDFDINTIDWLSSLSLEEEIAGENAIQPHGLGFHHFDIRTAVTNWVQGLSPNFGLVVKALDENVNGAGFYTTEADPSNVAQGGFTPDQAPSITINWSVPDPVDMNYDLGNTTINLRTMVKTDKKGKLQFQGVFADGLTTPGATVSYGLSDASKDYKGDSTASFSYKYPNTSTFESVFEAGTTKYRDKLSNWQTTVPFTEPELNAVYTIDAESRKDNQTSGKKSSETFLIYKVTQYDTLPKIAAYYGVPLNQIAYDNRIQDMLVVKNNTLFIRNPRKNATKPYNPPALNDKVKADVDMLLMGRGLHCEFGFEPINLNTGNFYLERVDVSIPDIDGDFEIARSYNSKAAGINSLFGRGWSFAFNEQISSDENQNLYYTRTDGSVVPFTKDGDSYKAPAGYDLTLKVKTIDTKDGDFGGEEKEKYDVKEYRVTDTDNQEKVFNFHGLLTSQTDEKGNTTQFEYNENFQLTKVTSPTGLVYGITYNEAGYIGAIQIPNGFTLSYDYDDNGYLTTYTDATGVPTRYEYDDRGRMTAWYDGNGTKVIQNEYDDENRVTKQTDGTGAVSTLAYSDGQTITTDANGNQTTYTYDDQYRTTGITYPDGTSVSKTYDDHNRLASETNELGHTTSYTYDENGNVLTETRFDGATKTSIYDEKNNLLSVTDFGGDTTTNEYDSKSNLTKTTLPDGTTISYTHDKQGRILSTIDALGAKTTFAYEGANLVKVTNPLGGESTLTYNAHNQVTGITNPRGGTTTFTYDVEGRQLSEKDADGVGTIHTFDKAGQVVGVTEGNGNTTTFTYDAFGRKIGASNGEGGTYSYTYDGVGNQLSVTDAEGHTTTYTYDSRGRLLTETNAAGQTTTFVRDALGRVLNRTNEAGHTSSLTYDDRYNAIKTVTDALGQVTENTYDASGYLTDSTYPIGTKTNTTYDVMGRVLSYTDESGQTVSYTYDAVGNKLTETKGDKTTSYSYDKSGNVTSITYPDKTSVSYTLDSMGNIVSMVDGLGKETTYEYSPAGRLLATTNALGQRTSMTYDKNGNQNSVTDAAGYTATTTYTGQNQIASITDGLGNTTTTSYNQMEQPTEIVDALGGKTTYIYNELGYPIEQTDANGNVTKMSYTETAQLKEVTLPDGTTLTQEYDALDRLIKQTSSSGLITEYTYDAANRVLTKKDNQELNESYTYDKAGNRLTLTNSLGEVTTYSYDSDNQLTKVTYADGTSETFTYDVMGHIATSTDQEGKTKTYHYDENGNLTKIVDHLKRETTYTYDALNRVVTETDAEGNTSTYEYDVLGNLSKLTDANGNSSSYGYDANQNLVLYTDPNGQATAFTYDPLGRVVETVAPTGAKQSFSYDAVGNRLTETTGEGHTTTFTYDVMNRLSGLKRPTGGETVYSYDGTGSLSEEKDVNGHITTYTNDLYGRTTKRILPNEAEYTYNYDALGRLSKQTGPQGLAKSYTYDVAGNLTKETDQSDRSNSYTYDKVGRLLTAKNALDLETKYRYDEAGNLEKLTSPSGASTSFSYTTLDQLKTIKSPTGRELASSYDPVGQVSKRTINGKRETSYTYDPNGNLLEETNPLGQVTKRTYDALNRLTSESDTAGQLNLYTYDHDNNVTKVMNEAGGQATMTYDGNGNLTSVLSGSERIKTYTYDLKDQLLSATQGAGDKASTSTYTYDSVGNVTSITNGNGKVTKYTYDQLSNVVERMTALGDKETYSYNINNQLEKVTKADGQTISYDYNKLDQLLKVDYSKKEDGQVLYTYDSDGRRVSMSDLTGTTHYETNAEGEITGVRQGDGSLIRYDYDDFGNISQMTYPDGSTVSYTYDELDRLTSVTDVKRVKTSYSYNEAGDMTEVKRGDGTKSFLTYDKAHRVTELRHVDKKNKLISSYTYEYDDGNYITKETITQDGETLVQAYTYDTLGQIETMTVSDKAGKELSKLTYTYDLAGNKLTSTEEVDGQEEKTTYTYDDNNRLTKLENKDGITTYTYDQNGNRISSKKNDEQLDYIYDTENRLLAVKDKDGLLMAALYDGDDNRVFTASRKEGKYTYQLFKREEKKKSPYTAPNGEEHSLFWYGFSQNVLQALSSLPQTVGTIWHEIFDDVSTAYHKKVAKDRANEEGLVVNPPSIGELPGEGEVTYASQVKEVLIPYTTREDSFNYYEERNYVNDINRQHTEVLQTYDRELKGRETYTYGHGRASYLNHETNDHYNYLTNQSGSVTGLTKEGQAVASISYNLYGSTKSITDETGNPFAYNGEARDITGFDYLRARYYDSQAGTFLTEDSYSGTKMNPLSQNRYSYVHNNPVNYTDPSGHIAASPFTMLLGAGKPRYSQPKPLINYKDGTLYAPATDEHKAHQIRQQQTGVYSYTYVPTYVPTASAYDYIQQQEAQVIAQAHAQAIRYRQQQLRKEYAQATGQYGTPKSREATNLFHNWTKSFEETIRHVCDPKTTKARDKGGSPKPISFGGGGVASWDGTSGPSSRYQPNASVSAKSKKPSKKKLSDKELSETIRRANQGDSKALSQLIAQQRYAPAYEGFESAPKAGAIIAAGIVGLVYKNPIYTLATYGGVNAGLTSAQKKESFGQVIVKSVIGAVSGYALGKIGAKIGAQSLLGAALVDGTGETALDVILAGLEGENVSPEELASSFVDNVAANAIIGLVGKAISNIAGAKVGNAVDEVGNSGKILTTKEIVDDFVKDLDDITSQGSLAKNFQSSGGFEQAMKDFESLNLDNVKVISTAGGSGKVGTLPDGTKVVVRPISRDGTPTLEFQFKVPYKVRY